MCSNSEQGCIYSGSKVVCGEIIKVNDEYVVYKDEDGKHLVPTSEFSMTTLRERDLTDRIRWKKKKILLKALAVYGSLFFLGTILIILLKVIRNGI